MRALLGVVLAVLLPAQAAQAATVGLEGTQLVFRADPGERVAVGLLQTPGGEFAFALGDARPGPGCATTKRAVVCPAASIAGFTMITGDADDRVGIVMDVPVTLSLGGGNDEFWVQSSGAITVDGGPGDDTGLIDLPLESVSLTGGEGNDVLAVGLSDFGDGPFTLDGGAGDDRLTVTHQGPRASVPGGHRPGRAAPVAISCGPGADRWRAGPYDLPGDGCAPALAGITTNSVSRAFREGAIAAAASGIVTLRRWTDTGPRERIARGTFSAQPGALRVSLRRTPAGREWLRRKPRLPVFVKVTTRAGAERGEITFNSRLK